MDELKRHRVAGRSAGPARTESDFSACNELGRARRYLHPWPELRILAQTSSIRVQETDDMLCLCKEFRNHEGVADTGIPTLIPTQEGRSPIQGSNDPYRLTIDCFNRLVFGEIDFGNKPELVAPLFPLSPGYKAFSIPRGR